ncbi:MAG TPA: hypothetical protein PLQ22_03105, partial [Bacilli bacterium]|nr:hypothetical protein [Bacilli bacterium]
MKKLCSITIKGKTKTWTFNTFVDLKYIDEWREDGIEIDPIENVIPVWVVDMRLTRIWCFLQDVWHGKYLRKLGW